LDWSGSAAFAEIVILRTFLHAGWSGRWVETYGAPPMQPYFLTEWHENGLKSAITQRITEARVTTLLEAIAHANGDTFAGCWDVVAWDDNSVVFAEAKRKGKDWLKATQLQWIAAALEHGFCDEEAFLVVEWRS
jgi:hypothetical protein